MSADTVHPPAELIAAYALDSVTAAERAETEAHVGRCDECRADVRALRAVVSLITPDVALPPGLWNRIEAAIRN